MSSTRWWFTLYNYTVEDVARIQAWDTRYLIFAKDVCWRTDTPQLEGYIVFPSPYRLLDVIRLHPEFSWHPASVECAALDPCFFFKMRGDYVCTGDPTSMYADRTPKKRDRNDRDRDDYDDVVAKLPRISKS